MRSKLGSRRLDRICDALRHNFPTVGTIHSRYKEQGGQP